MVRFKSIFDFMSHNNMNNKTKTIIFASLIAGVLLTSGMLMNEATAKEQIGKEPKFKNLSKEVKAKIFKDNAEKPINIIGSDLLKILK